MQKIILSLLLFMLMQFLILCTEYSKNHNIPNSVRMKTGQLINLIDDITKYTEDVGKNEPQISGYATFESKKCIVNNGV
jgi:hypothetical protein